MQTLAQAERAAQSFEDARLAAYLDSQDEEPFDYRDCPGWDLGECWSCPKEGECFPDLAD